MGLRERDVTARRAGIPVSGPHLDVFFNLIVTGDKAPHVKGPGIQVHVLPGEVGELSDGDTCSEGKIDADIHRGTVVPDVIQDGPLFLYGQEPEVLRLLLGLMGDRPGRHGPPLLLPGITEDAHKDIHGIMGSPLRDS